MDIIVFRGLPGSRTIEAARLLLHRPVDHIVDLTDFWERSQGNLFISETLPEEAKDEVETLLRSQEISRLGICGMIDKGWVESVVERIGIEDPNIFWLVVENAERPGRGTKKIYKRMERTFDIDLYKDA